MILKTYFVLLYVVIQLVSLALLLIGIPICAWLAYSGRYRLGKDDKFHFPWWAWIWDNAEDGVLPAAYRAAHPEWTIDEVVFHWTGLRNNCNNLRFVPGVSQVGRPLWQVTWRKWYAQAGWNDRGWPVLSAGAN